MHGKGRYYYAANGNEYNGDWVNDKKHGFGDFVWKSGDRYRGHYLNDKKSGHGIYTWPNGDKYDG